MSAPCFKNDHIFNEQQKTKRHLFRTISPLRIAKLLLQKQFLNPPRETCWWPRLPFRRCCHARSKGHKELLSTPNVISKVSKSTGLRPFKPFKMWRFWDSHHVKIAKVCQQHARLKGVFWHTPSFRIPALRSFQ